MEPYGKLDDLTVASPCTAKWSEMKGDQKVRHCDLCGLNVYNLSALKKADAEALINKKEGRVCVRFYKRADGTVLTADCPVGLRKARVRLAKVAGFLVALLTLAGVGVWARSLYRRVTRVLDVVTRRQATMGDMARPSMLMGAPVPPSTSPR